jgi:hypothetical protein
MLVGSSCMVLAPRLWIENPASMTDTRAADYSIIEIAAVAKVKYQRGESRRVPPFEKGVDPWNRPIMEEKVHNLASTLAAQGWDTNHEYGCVVEEEPGSRYILDHNVALHDGSELLPIFGDSARRLMKYSTADHGHQNYALRCFYFGIHCRHDGHADVNGWMTLHHLKAVRPSVHKIAVEGPMTIILGWEIRTEAPEMLRAVIESGNISHSTYMKKHALESIQNLGRICVRLASLGEGDLHDRVMQAYKCENEALPRDVFEAFFFFASRFGHCIPNLHEFLGACVPEDRTILPAFYGWVGKFPADFMPVVEALVMTNLGAPADKGPLSVYLSKTNVEELLPAGKHHALAQKALEFFVEFDMHYALFLRALAAKKRIVFRAQFRKAVGEIITGKNKDEHQNLASVATAFAKLRQKMTTTASKLAEKEKIAEPIKFAPTQLVEAVLCKPRQGEEMVAYAPDGSVTILQQLLDRGYAVGTHVAIDPTISPNWPQQLRRAMGGQWDAVDAPKIEEGATVIACISAAAPKVEERATVIACITAITSTALALKHEHYDIKFQLALSNKTLKEVLEIAPLGKRTPFPRWRNFIDAAGISRALFYDRKQSIE